MSSSKPPPSEGQHAAELCLVAYGDAVSWRRRVKRELKPMGITLTQWIVMRAIGDVVRETRDAASELVVAQKSGVDRMTVSQVAWRLAYQDLVSIGPNAFWPGLRLFLNERGEQKVLEGARRIEAVSLAWLSDRSGRAA